jgi:integrase
MLYRRKRPDGSLGKTWWVRFTIRGREVNVTSGATRKALAEEFERSLRDQLWREIQLGEVLRTWKEAKDQWLIDKASKRSLARDKEAFAIFEQVRHEGQPLITDDSALADFDEELILKLETALREGRKGSTVVRLLAVLRSVLRRAVKKWKWIPKAPEFEPTPKDKSEPRWITEEQFDVLWMELPVHAQQIVRFAVAVGPRSGNIFRLRWTDIDLEARVMRIGASTVKGAESVGFPLSEEAMIVLEQQKGLHKEYVFTDQRGRAPIGSIKTCWRKARKRAGLPSLKVHDLRHTFAAWHKLRGTPNHALQQLGGWKDPRMVEKYGHINPVDYAHFVDNRRAKSGTRQDS